MFQLKTLYNARDLYGAKLYKILTSDMKSLDYEYIGGQHHNIQFREGINQDQIFNPNGVHEPGGLYICGDDDIIYHTSRGDQIADARVYREHSTFKVSEFELYNMQSIKDLDKWHDPDFCRKAVKAVPSNIKYVKNQTPELCKLALENYGLPLKFVTHQTPELCKLAVTNCGRALIFVQHQTPELCNIALDHGGLVTDIRDLEMRNMVTNQRSKIITKIT